MEYIAAPSNDRHRFRLLALLLSIFHLAIWHSGDTYFSITFMLMHAGIFLFWQPVWNQSQRINLVKGLFLIVILVAVLWWFKYLFFAIWTVFLIALVTSGALNPKERFLQLFCLVYLLVVLFVSVIPQLFKIALVSPEWWPWLQLGLTMLPLPMLVFSAPVTVRRSHQLDFIRGLMISLLSLLLALGSLLRMYQGKVGYGQALLETFVLLGGLMLIVSWVWTLCGGSFSFLWSRMLLSVGTPVESFLLKLTQKAKEDITPEEFLSKSFDYLHEFDWIEGVTWASASGAGSIGSDHGPLFPISFGDLRIKIWTRQELNTALILHTKLLVNIVAVFYIGKQREHRLAQKAHLEAIYETGARLTHDMKNMLQSLRMLSKAILHSEEEDATEVLQLVKRQLPALNERLQTTLEKLTSPGIESQTMITAGEWWQQLQDRNYGRELNYVYAIEDDYKLPGELFDTAADNLIDNARLKRLRDMGIEIDICLTLKNDTPLLEVIDTGWAVPAEIANHLFEDAIESQSGLGIGLLQTAKQASKNGYRLYLKSNRPGVVSFVLEQVSAEK